MFIVVAGVFTLVLAILFILSDPFEVRKIKTRIKQFDADNKYWKPNDTFLNLVDVKKNPKTCRSYKLLT